MLSHLLSKERVHGRAAFFGGGLGAMALVDFQAFRSLE
jgi:hypothetical protein